MRPKGTDWSQQPLGKEPDLHIARRLGLTQGAVSSARRRRGIPAFPRATVERLGGVHLLGIGLTDREVADRLGCSTYAVIGIRQRLGIPSTLVHIDWAAVPLGQDWDLHIARRYGVSVASVCAVRRRRGIPRYAPERTCACGVAFRAGWESQKWCSVSCQDAAGSARTAGRDGAEVGWYVAMHALRRAVKRARRGARIVDAIKRCGE